MLEKISIAFWFGVIWWITRYLSSILIDDEKYSTKWLVIICLLSWLFGIWLYLLASAITDEPEVKFGIWYFGGILATGFMKKILKKEWDIAEKIIDNTVSLSTNLIKKWTDLVN